MINPVLSLTIDGDKNAVHEIILLLIECHVSFWYSAKTESVRVVIRNERRLWRLERECKAMGLNTTRKKYY